MKQPNKNFWISTDDLNKTPEFTQPNGQEFFELPVIEALSKDAADIEEATEGTNRRDFLKYVGFGLGAATIAAGCESPVRKAIPYVTKPDAIVPGVASFYASTIVDGGDVMPVLVKTREGRPIKIEGNKSAEWLGGGTSARVQAAVLSLYDTYRTRSAGTVKDGAVTELSWADLDKAVMSKLTAASNIRIVTNTITSPTTKAVLADFVAKYPNTKVVTIDPVSSSAMLVANEQSFGMKVIPAYHFDKAEVIVSFDADFLGTWVSPTEFSRQYVKGRKIKDVHHAKQSHHIQFESGMSMTGSNADNRVLVKPSEQGAAMVTLYNAIAGKVGAGTIAAVSNTFANPKAIKGIQLTAEKLVAAKGKSLVVSGSNDVNEQVVINAINNLLGNYGNTLDFTHYSNQRQGVDADAQALVNDLKGGKVDAVFVYNANPVYTLPNGAALADAIKKAGLSVSFNQTMDETTAACQYVAPDHHNLEAWGDAEPKNGHFALIQPTIAPLFATRAAQVSLLTWAGAELKGEQPYYEYLKNNWQNKFGTGAFAKFQSFWDNTLHDGVYSTSVAASVVTFGADANAAASNITPPSAAAIEIDFYETINMGGGQFANNPWLQEMPDPVTRTTWGNHLAVPIKWEGVNSFAGFKNLKDGDLVELTVNGVKITVPVVRQFGQMDGTVSLALGYGRTMAGKAGNGVGVNVNPALKLDKGSISYKSVDVQVSDKVGADSIFACVQHHHTFGVTGVDQEDGQVKNVDEKALGYKGYQGSLTDRSIFFHTTVNEVEAYAETIAKKRNTYKHLNENTLYPFEEYKKNVYGQGHHWGMSIDLTSCIGCAACVVACTAENNVPVVGKREVHRHHEMTWLRIDRYFYGDVENPNAVYQPMLCQHCENAPCENVCPVGATNHSSEGLNQMTYNRCIGTRYCANNCPYKVRRFNWLDYTSADMFPANEVDLNYGREGAEENTYMTDNLTRMVLNPDVTVRSRGVIEKCSFCVQRIQESKLTAKKENRRLEDGDVKTACQSACPTDAIVFGDRNIKGGEVQKMWESDLNYYVLEEVNVQSSIGYLAKVNNRDEKFDA